MMLTQGQGRLGWGLREPLRTFLKERESSFQFLEVCTENFIFTRGQTFDNLLEWRETKEISAHGLSLNIASYELPSIEYLQQLSEFQNIFQCFLISDHLCWTSLKGKPTYDLLPFPFTKQMLDHLIPRIQFVQDFLERPLVLENISTYLRYKTDEMSELEFTTELIKRSGCQILLDLNNLYVNQANHGSSATEFIEKIPASSVAAYHLAGHSQREGFLFDTHDSQVHLDVWKLYQFALQKIGARPVSIEWDQNFPTPQILDSEFEILKELTAGEETHVA